MTGRETAISEAVQKSPGYVPEERGLLVQLATLEALTKENPRIGVIVWLLDLVAVGFELAAMLGASAYAPTCYASLLTKRQYLHDLSVADEIGEALEASADKQTRSKEAKQEGLKRQSAFQRENEPTSPQRRPRGRPRKNAFVVTPVGPPTQA